MAIYYTVQAEHNAKSKKGDKQIFKNLWMHLTNSLI